MIETRLLGELDALSLFVEDLVRWERQGEATARWMSTPETSFETGDDGLQSLHRPSFLF